MRAAFWHNSRFFSHPLFFLPLYRDRSYRRTVASYKFHRQCDNIRTFKIDLIKKCPVFSDHQSFFREQIVYRKFRSACLIRIDRINSDKANPIIILIFCYISVYIWMVEKFICTSCFIPVCIKENDFSFTNFFFIRFDIF